jgi:hypothetical protein
VAKVQWLEQLTYDPMFKGSKSKRHCHKEKIVGKTFFNWGSAGVRAIDL